MVLVCIYWDNHIIFFIPSDSVMLYTDLLMFLKVKKLCILAPQPPSQCIIFLTYCWTQLANICLTFCLDTYSRAACNFNSCFIPCHILISILYYLQKTIWRLYFFQSLEKSPQTGNNFFLEHSCNLPVEPLGLNFSLWKGYWLWSYYLKDCRK